MSFAVRVAVDDVHAQSAGWISNRNVLWATTLGLAAVVVHHRWRADGWGRPTGIARCG